MSLFRLIAQALVVTFQKEPPRNHSGLFGRAFSNSATFSLGRAFALDELEYQKRRAKRGPNSTTQVNVPSQVLEARAFSSVHRSGGRPLSLRLYPEPRS